MKVLVLLNEKSGTLATSATRDEARRIAQGFAARGVEADVRSVPGRTLQEIAKAARHRRDGNGKFDAVVGGGGDGTLNTLANVLAGGDVPFAVLPLGTHNHFAKELQIPLDLDQAVAALADSLRAGSVVDLDVGEVNGRIFLNFSGVGLHPQLVVERDARHQELKKVRWLRRLLRRLLKVLAMVMAFSRALARLPIMMAWITTGGRTIRRLTPSLIVCNNPYQMKVFGVENVSYPQRCWLHVYIAKSRGGAGLVRLLIGSLLRRLENLREFETLCLKDVTIATRRRRLSVSVDGEVMTMRTPLKYRLREGGLKVVVPVAERGTKNAER